MIKVKSKTARLVQFMAVSVLIAAFMSCHKELKPATVVVVDPVRHYYPVIQGDLMHITYDIENTSSNPLFISEVHTTCGCIVPTAQLPIVVLPHKMGKVSISYNTIKNTGYVDHFIYCYGNFKDSTYIELEFDTNIVPQADYVRDYEQLWHEQTGKSKTMQEYIEGMPEQKGYYTD